MIVATDLWESLIASVTVPNPMAKIRRIAVEAEARRKKADYDTGSITEDEGFYLLAMAEHIKARTVIEVGTFIGTSTMCMALAPTVEAIYTCDASNDCLPSTDVVRTYPKQTSNQMLLELVRGAVTADLCFFDGVVSVGDAELLRDLTHRDTVFAFHDFNYGPKIRQGKNGTYLEQVARKGVGNMQLMKRPTHLLIEPRDGSTMALLVPRSMR